MSGEMDQHLGADELVGLLGAWAGGARPVYEQLARRIGALVDDGLLRDGARLPAERGLAATLGVSRGTVVRAYGALEDDRRVERRQGSGTRVRSAEVPGPPRRHRTTPLFDSSASTALLKAVPRNLLDLPAELAALAGAGPASQIDLEPEGLWSLRCAVAEHLSDHGVATEPAQVLVSSGTQHACSLVIRALCRPGDVVLTEALTWPGLTDTISATGARSYGVGMDAHGIRTEELRAAVERLRPAAVVLNPHHHNPTGSRLVPHRRREVADIAADYGVPVVEDRAYAALAFDGVVEPPIAVHRPDAPVIVIDSISKVVWDGLRIGWVRGSVDLIGRLRLLRAIDDMGTAIPSQLLAERILPRFDDLLAVRVEELTRKAAHAFDVVSDLLPEWTVAPPVGGGSLWTTLPVRAARAFRGHAARAGVLVVTDEAFSTGEAADESIRLPFTAPEDVFRGAIEQLASAWAGFEPSDRPPETVTADGPVV